MKLRGENRTRKRYLHSGELLGQGVEKKKIQSKPEADLSPVVIQRIHKLGRFFLRKELESGGPDMALDDMLAFTHLCFPTDKEVTQPTQVAVDKMIKNLAERFKSFTQIYWETAIKILLGLVVYADEEVPQAIKGKEGKLRGVLMAEVSSKEELHVWRAAELSFALSLISPGMKKMVQEATALATPLTTAILLPANHDQDLAFACNMLARAEWMIVFDHRQGLPDELLEKLMTIRNSMIKEALELSAIKGKRPAGSNEQEKDLWTQVLKASFALAVMTADEVSFTGGTPHFVFSAPLPKSVRLPDRELS